MISTDGGGGRVIKLKSFCGHHKYKIPKRVMIYDVQISRIKKKNTLCTRSKTFYKVCVQGEGV